MAWARSREIDEVNWFTLDHRTGKGRLLQTDRSHALARNFSCGTYTNLCGESYGLRIDTFSSGAMVGFGAISVDFCRTNIPRYCSGERADGGTARYSWTSNDSTVASVSGSNMARSGSPLEQDQAQLQSRGMMAGCSLDSFASTWHGMQCRIPLIRRLESMAKICSLSLT